MSTYRYYKRSEQRDSQPWMILRESRQNLFKLELWREDHWVNAIEFWWQTRQEYDYWDISEREAMSELPKLSERQQAARQAREAEDTEARAKILRDRKAERDRRNELDDWTQLERSAIALHELFNTFVNAGFSEDQALKLVSRLMTSTDGHDA